MIIIFVAINKLYTIINNMEKKQKCQKNLCNGAKHHTIGSAYKALKNNIKVYLVEEEINGQKKINAYSRCSISCLNKKVDHHIHEITNDDNKKNDDIKNDENEYKLCHLHREMNKDRLKIFDRDILPRSSNDKTRKLAHEEDDFFENMGKRGTKKKNIDKTFYFENLTDPIYLILTNSNHKLRTLLSLYAIELLTDNNNELLKNNNYLSSKKKDPIKENLNNMISLISSSNPLIDSSKLSSTLSVDSILEEEEEEEEESVSEVEISVIEIYTNKGRLLLYDSETNIVYNPEDTRKNGMGKLVKIPLKYSTIKIKNDNYTVITEFLHKKYAKINCCVLTDKLYNDNFDYIGIRKKNKYDKNKYDLEFIDEI